MKLKSFIKPEKTVASRLVPIATFSISKANVIFFNKVACEVLDIKPEHFIEFLNDEDEPRDWYFRKTDADNPNGFKLREMKAGGVAINNTALALAMRKTLKHGDESLKYRVATQPDEKYDVYGILTAKNLNDKQK